VYLCVAPTGEGAPNGHLNENYIRTTKKLHTATENNPHQPTPSDCYQTGENPYHT